MKYRYLLLLSVTYSLCASKIHQPQMPRGLSANKTPPSSIVPKKQKARKFHIFGDRHTFSYMDYDELKAAKEKNKTAKNWDLVCKYLERMIIMLPTDENGFTDLKEKAALILELADTLFDQKKYDDATKWYTEFTQVSPGNDQIEYASYKAIICASKNILSIDRDQAPTEKTLELADTFLKRDAFKTYKADVEKIRHECYQTLALSDCNVAEFYLKYGNYKAAQTRLESVRAEWLGKVPEINQNLANLEVALSLEYSEFKVPESSLKLAQVAKPSPKVDMTSRF